MQKKVLFISTIAIFSRFNLPFMRWFREQGWRVDYISDGKIEISDCDNQYTISIKRSPFNFKNIVAYNDLKRIMIMNDYDIIHCHTPMGGVLGRIAAKASKTNAKVIYTAHGFHFYRGAPIVNWLLYYPIEKHLAKYTDTLITINDEDYNIAKNKFVSCKKICKIDGVGIDLSKFYPRLVNEKMYLRKELGYADRDFIITNVAEINKNKNQLMLIKALPELKKAIPELRVLFIGNDNYSKVMKKLKTLIAKMNIQNYVSFLGYRSDVDKLTVMGDIAFSASIREGLPVNIIEAMASGVSIVCSKNRGHNSLIDSGKTGLIFSTNKEMMENILKIYNSKSFAEILGKNAFINSKKYSREIIINKIADIYTAAYTR